MSDAVIEAVRDKIFAPLPRDSAPSVVWHAGEPTAAPIAWYEHAYARLMSAVPPQTSFAVQSNGIAIDERWIDLFQRTNTNISLSIDGPQRFHDERRRTRSGKPTWHLAMAALKRMQSASIQPSVITVLHPDGLDFVEEYYAFYRDNNISQVSFSIDELEGANSKSSFASRDYKPQLTRFLVSIMERAYEDGFALNIREVERIALLLAGNDIVANEQVEPWASIVVAADGSISTFSPEIMEVHAPAYGSFVFGNILEGDLATFSRTDTFARVCREVAAGVDACRASCRYFDVCGGGSPVNKLCERGDLAATETNFCRLTSQTAAEALLTFLERRQPCRNC